MEFIRTFTKTFDLGDSARLTIENRSGTISIRGEDTDRVAVEVVARLWAEDEREADDQEELVRRAIRGEGTHVSIRAPSLPRPRPLFFFGHGPRIDYQVTVPRKTAAEVTSRSGRVDVTNVAGPLQIEARSGRVALRDIGGKTRIVSRSGGIQVESIDGDLGIDSRSGTIRVERCKQDLTIQARSGSVQVADAAAGVKVELRNGSLRYEGAVRGMFGIKIQSGSVRLTLDADSRFFLDAESARGAVRSEMPVRSGSSGGRPPNDAPKVRIRTRSGSIHLLPR